MRLECQSCVREFEITYEPKAKDDPSAQNEIGEVDITFCPFCGDEYVLEEA